MYIVVYITCESRKQARKITKNLMKEHLIACANMMPIESMFWWKGEIQKEEEYLLIAKAREEDFERLKIRAKELHSYQVPCIVSVPLLDANEDYLSWILESTDKTKLRS